MLLLLKMYVVLAIACLDVPASPDESAIIASEKTAD